MALASHITEQVDIPHEPGEWLRLRLLNWTDLKAARDARSEAQSSIYRTTVKELGAEATVAIQQAAQQRRESAAVPVSAEPPDLADTYDQATVLTRGIVGWSYEAPVTPETIADLDEVTAEWALGAILGLHFLRSKDPERKNGSAPSMPLLTVTRAQ